MEHQKVNFPKRLDPAKCPVFAKNEITIHASPETIWKWLIQVTTWPDWYPNSSNIKIIDQKEQVLLAHTQFKWRTFKTNISSTVREFRPYHSLSWEAKGSGLNAYHGWLIVPIANGCLVITEETQYGFLPSLAGSFIKKGLLKQHQIWLEGLKRKSEAKRGNSSKDS